jgi:hypothetical protein
MYIFILLLALVSTSHACTHILPLQARRHAENNTAVVIKKTCRRIEVLTKLHNIANNQTALDDMLADSKLAQVRIDWIKNKSAGTTPELETLTANATLTAECDSIKAQRDTANECRKLEQLERLVDLANNLAPPALLTQDQRDRLQQTLEKVALKLQELRNNSTLMGLCAEDVELEPDGAISNRKWYYLNVYGRDTDRRVEEVDSSGAISLTKSGAVTYQALSRTTSSLMALILLVFILAL